MSGDGLAGDLDAILDQLNLRRQRATYGAIGEVVRRPPFYLMAGGPRDARHSWIVNQESGMPSGYEKDQLHPDLESRSDIIRSGDQLRHWLGEDG